MSWALAGGAGSANGGPGLRFGGAFFAAGAAGFRPAGPGLGAAPGFAGALGRGPGLTAGLLASAGLASEAVDASVLAGFSSVPADAALANSCRNRRATGASTVLDADFTNSPMSLSLPSTTLLVTPSSFASSCTRGLAATALLNPRSCGAHPADLIYALDAWSLRRLHRVLMSGLPTLLSRTDTSVSTIDFPSHADRVIGHERLQFRHVVTLRQSKGSTEGALPQRLSQALQNGVNMCAATSAPTNRVGDQSHPRGHRVSHRDDTQQLGGRRADTTTHTRAYDFCATDHQKYYLYMTKPTYPTSETRVSTPCGRLAATVHEGSRTGENVGVYQVFRTVDGTGDRPVDNEPVIPVTPAPNRSRCPI